jgi:hypothetical protein
MLINGESSIRYAHGATASLNAPAQFVHPVNTIRPLNTAPVHPV